MDDDIDADVYGDVQQPPDSELPVAPDEVLGDIANLAVGCRDLLQQLSTHYESQSVPNSEAKSQRIAFEIWAAAVGAYRHGEQSLAYRLKSLPETSDQILKLLSSLRILLKRQLEVPKLGEEASLSGSDSETSSVYSATSVRLAHYSDDDSDIVPSSDSLWTSIHDTIVSLRQLGLQLRRAGASHRRERVRRFMQLPRNKHLYDLVRSIALQTIKYRFPKMIWWLQERIADSIVIRRGRVLYLEQHQVKIRVAEQSVRPVPRREPSIIVPVPNDAVGAQDPELVVRPPTISESISPSLNQRTEVSQTIATKYTKVTKAPSVSSMTIITGSFPSFPAVEPTSNSFTCPYCSLDYPATDFTSQSAWYTHLIHDLEPFFCVEQECENPFDCSSSYGSWIAHMKKEHGNPKWQCWYCPQSPAGPLEFTSSPAFEDHLTTNHGDKVTDSLRDTVIKHSIIHGDLKVLSCVFCGGYPAAIEATHQNPHTPEAIEALLKHIRNHLISYALILLPRSLDSIQADVERGSDAGDDGGNASDKDVENISVLEGLVTDEQLRCSSEYCECHIPSSIETGDWSKLNNENPPGHSPADAIQRTLNETQQTHDTDEWEFCSPFSSTDYPDLERDKVLHEYFQLKSFAAPDAKSSDPNIPSSDALDAEYSGPSFDMLVPPNLMPIFRAIYTDQCGKEQSLTNGRLYCFLRFTQNIYPVPEMEHKYYGFMQFVLFTVEHNIWSRLAAPTATPLDYPMTNYFINSSGDMFNIGDRLVRRHELDIYTSGLLGEYRCIEFTVWNSDATYPLESPPPTSTLPSTRFSRQNKMPSSLEHPIASASVGDNSHYSFPSRRLSSQAVEHATEPVVKYARDSLAWFGFRSVCESIRNTAFVVNELPIIVIITVYADLRHQNMMVKTLKEVWRGLLVDAPIEGCDPNFKVPRLGEVKRRIFLQIRNVPSDEVQPRLPTLETAQPQQAIYPPLRDLCVYTRSERFEDYQSLSQTIAEHPAHIFSISEAGINMANLQDNRALFLHNKSFFMRAYPSFRSSSSVNMDLRTLWTKGVQMAAVNLSDMDESMMLNRAMFQDTNGWVLKPSGYQSSDKISEIAEQAVSPMTIDLDVTIYLGLNVAPPNPRLGGSTRCMVDIELHTDQNVDAWTTRKYRPFQYKKKTSIRESCDPFWGENGETLRFRQISGVVPLLNFLRFAVKDADATVPTDFSWACIRLDRVQQGYQFIQLHNPQGNPVLDGKLFVKIETAERG